MKTFLFLATGTAALAALPAAGPDYARPSVPNAVAFHDVPPADTPTWKVATPADASARGEWWRIFHDPVLDALETRALSANQNLFAAAARVEQSRAAAGLARAGYFPSAILNATATRERSSLATDNRQPAQHTTTIGGALHAAWEIDLFGRVRRLNEGALNEAIAGDATLESIRLSLTAEVATSYFALRAMDRETAILAEGVTLRRRALDLVDSRKSAGAATDFDHARALTELASTEAEAAELAIRRARLQNALAVLIGEAAPEFSLEESTAEIARPATVPPGLPSDLLERRPDVAAAERQLAAANARIGVAKAAFFPSISLTGVAGQASGDLDRLFSTDAKLWGIGPSIHLPLFQGGRNRANLARARAAHEEAVANYRHQILVAFQEVQDALTATRLLAGQAAAQERAVTSARVAADLARRRFEAGYVNFFEVIDAERAVLATERASAQLSAQQLSARVLLIKALGGGFHSIAPGSSAQANNLGSVRKHQTQSSTSTPP